MQFLVAFLLFGTFAFAEDVQEISGHNPTFGYMKNIGIPEAERIRKAEEADSRVSGGVPAALGQYHFLAGILAELIRNDIVYNSVCGGSLISTRRVLSAAHCWFDGLLQARRFTIVLGSVTLFRGGVRVDTSAVAVHPFWNPFHFRFDVLVAYLPAPVQVSDIIAPVSLPFGSELEIESFAGERAIVVGYGATSDSGSITMNQLLNHVNVTVITNSNCSETFPIIQPSNICTSGLGGVGFCRGDNGGPLIVQRGNRLLQIGVASFGPSRGCQAGVPSAYARVTSFIDFIIKNLIRPRP